jgi:hypothetical protein
MFICFFQDIHKTTIQNQPTPTRLFYIQHSDNPNTYVYDANIKAGIIVPLLTLTHTALFILKWCKKPCQDYKISYGIILLDSKPNI